MGPFPTDRPLCPECLVRLDQIQPDGDRPESLLGVCHDCRSWWVIDSDGVRAIYRPNPPAVPAAPVGGL